MSESRSIVDSINRVLTPKRIDSEQGPFMLMVPTADSTDFTSRVYALYYGKSSVTMTQ